MSHLKVERLILTLLFMSLKWDFLAEVAFLIQYECITITKSGKSCARLEASKETCKE